MPSGSSEKLKITADDLAASVPQSCTGQAVSIEPRLVILDPVPLQKSSRRYVPLVVIGMLQFIVTSTLLWQIAVPQASWTEQIAATAHRSIVQIRTQNGVGTGFVIFSQHQRHLILTSRHVLDADNAGSFVAGRDTVQFEVILRSGESIPGRLAGLPIDPLLDLALLEVSVSGLKPLGKIGSFSNVRAGQRVAAVGHPHGLDFTITDGIVSAKRDGLMIQTSAAINPGNSGGPLVDERLHVIGINTSTVRPDTAQGLSFAIRADLAKDATAWNLTDTAADLMHYVGQ
jgi:S1-C subfamily serine protease